MPSSEPVVNIQIIRCPCYLVNCVCYHLCMCRNSPEKRRKKAKCNGQWTTTARQCLQNYWSVLSNILNARSNCNVAVIINRIIRINKGHVCHTRANTHTMQYYPILLARLSGFSKMWIVRKRMPRALLSFAHLFHLFVIGSLRIGLQLLQFLFYRMHCHL